MDDFYKKISNCVNQCILSLKGIAEIKKKHITKRLEYLLNEIQYKSNFTSKNVRNLVFVLVYFGFNRLIEKFFQNENKKDDQSSDQNNEIEILFLHYYKSCIINKDIVGLLENIDHAFTTELENHLKQGVNFVPCISLFKRYDDNDNNEIIKKSKESWLLLVIILISRQNTELKRQLYKLFQSFQHSFHIKADKKCRIEFFCTVILPLLDDLNLIDCMRGDF